MSIPHVTLWQVSALCMLQAPPQQVMGGAPMMGVPQQGMYPPPQARIS